MGLLPTGTGNLLARNMRMAIGDLTRATRIALCGDNRAIDVGRVLIDNRDEEHVFLVMAGVGFDAAVMAGAPHDLNRTFVILGMDIWGDLRVRW
jgi:diacylglycerol kinase (ATP)